MLLSKDCTGFAHALQSCSSPTLKNAYATKARDGLLSILPGLKPTTS